MGGGAEVVLLKLSCKARGWLLRTNVWSEEVQGGARGDVVTRKVTPLPLEKCPGSPGAFFDLLSFVIFCVCVYLSLHHTRHMLSLSLSHTLSPCPKEKGRLLRMFLQGVGLCDSSPPWV